MPFKYKYLPSPVGCLKLIASDQELRAILWDTEKPNRVLLETSIEDNLHPILLETEHQLKEYFLKQRNIFDLPLKAQGTPFQVDVWRLLQQIPYGATCSYKDIAIKIGRPNAVRAVGTAIGRNPLSIIIPCHRVIGSDGSLGGFAGGLDRKKQLLDLELRN